MILQELKVAEQAIGWTEDHIVNTSDSEHLGVQQDQFIPTLIKAVQQLSTELDTAKARIEALENA